jgi:hypothetical protein
MGRNRVFVGAEQLDLLDKAETCESGTDKVYR